jgi:pyruvate, water dikinase
MELRRVFGWRRARVSLEERLTAYREVLQANNAALGFLARIQEALEGDAPLRAAEVRRLTTGVTVQTYRMISTLHRVTGGKQLVVRKRFDALKAEIARSVELTPALGPRRLTIPLAEVDASLAERVGSKSALLGEARRLFPQQVPDGFATTVDAFETFMGASGLRDQLAELLRDLDAGDVARCFEVSSRAVQLVESAPVPDELAAALGAAVQAMAGGEELRLAVRSSALQEGGLEVSFAGQYRSLLNVAPAGVVDAFRQVVASKYSPQALIYRLSRGYDDAEVGMCCCVIAMVRAEAAGVLYSAWPGDVDESARGQRRTVVQAVRGLGLSAVDGSVQPDTFFVDRGRRKVVEVRLGLQPHQLRCADGEGTERLEVSDAERTQTAIGEGQALELCRLAWRLEEALGQALDLEWAVDGAGKLVLLQVRPLSDQLAAPVGPRRERVPGATILLDQGSRASGGAACGQTFRVESDLDILCCPAGAVAVLREANPRYAAVLPRVAAVVADFGELTGHLATVARELRVPALFGSRRATTVLVDAREVTVDADAGVVYEGRVAAALARSTAARPTRARDPNRERLGKVAELIVPLTLRDRLTSGHSPRRCRTMHDLIRYCHQATIEALFDLGDSALRDEHRPRKLVSDVPIDCRVIDLGGGLAAGLEGQEVHLEQVTCRPLLALWRGMTDSRLCWWQERPVSLRGLMSALVNYNFDDDARLRRMGEPSFAFVAADYLNLNSRIGYHFATIDARLGELSETNYASFRFAGGSTGIDQRSRRAQLLQRLLAARGFETDCRADLVNARLRHLGADEIAGALETVGLLMGFVNHLDMALTSDEILARYEQAFLAGDYGYGKTQHAG